MAIVNLEEMADLLDVSRPTMRDLVRRYPDLPVIERGSNGVPWRFEAEAVLAFVAAQREKEAAEKAARGEEISQLGLAIDDLLPPEERGQTAADRLKIAQAMLKEDELAKQRSFLVSTHGMRDCLGPVWTGLNQFLQALPNTLQRRYNLPPEVVRDMRRQIAQQQREAYRRLVEMLPADAAPPEDTDDAPP